jgi:6-phosphofructo-2-kinase
MNNALRYIEFFYCFQEVKISNPDYKGVDKNIAAEDFKKRIALYEAQYEPIDDDHDKHLSFIKIFNQGASFVINKIQGFS